MLQIIKPFIYKKGIKKNTKEKFKMMKSLSMYALPKGTAYIHI